MIESKAGHKKKRGALLVHEQLRNDILRMRLAPGSALDEVSLAERFEVSRTPIREALLLLSGEGLVQFLQNRTTIVSPLSLNNSGEYFDTLLVLARSVGRSAAAKASLKISDIDVQLAEAKQAASKMDVQTILQCHLHICRALSQTTGNMFLDKYYREALDGGIRTKLLHFFPNATPKEVMQSVTMVQHIVDCVLSGDTEGSDEAMRDLIIFEAGIVLRSLQPKYGATMDLGHIGAEL